jgi:serine/threonine protein kinase
MTMDRLGRYEILEELGRGAMGNVYRARDPKIGRVVAIKTVRAFGARPGEDEEYRQRFFREAQAAGNLSHPGIVTIYDVGEEETTQTPYIVMEYIAGRTLESLLTDDSCQRPSLDTNIDLVRQLAEALDYAHAQNIVHRDIKPANIIVTLEGRAKITDFGVARLTQSEFTVQGQLIGTPAYMSPEQLKGEPVDGRSDLFSLGVILYWLLTGEKPFVGDPTTVIAKILYGDPTPVSHLNSFLGSEYDRIVSRALAKDPAARYQRGKQLAEELYHLRAGKIAPARLNPLADASPKDTLVQASPHSTVPEKTVLLSPRKTLLFSWAQRRSKRAGRGASRALTKVALASLIVSVLFGLSALLFLRSETAPSVTKSIAATNKAASRVSSLPRHKISEAIVARKASDSAILQIRCWHDFDSADLSVWVGNDLVYGTTLKVSGKRTNGYLATTVSAPQGNHTVRVQVKSSRGRYYQTKVIDGDLAKDRDNTLEITCSEIDNDLRLAWQN